MSQSNPRIHPTAILSPEVELAEDVSVGPFTIMEGPVKLGAGCHIGPRVHLIGPITMGVGNKVHTGAVIGDRPQHLKYNDEPTGVEIGDYNTFRENVTIHRGTDHSWVTRIGSHNFLMAGSHVAHDCTLGNRCIIANNTLIGGHVEVGDNVYLSGNCAVHQFCRIGRLALMGGCSATTKDIPPFVSQMEVDNVIGVNLVGMRRAGIDREEINAVRQAFRVLFRSGLTVPFALARLESEFGEVSAVREMIEFLRGTKRGINMMRGRALDDAA